MRCFRSAVIVALGALVLVADLHAPARASGSAEVVVATPTHSLRVYQTFRKILPRGAGKTYYPRVRENFLRVHKGLHGPLTAWVGTVARPKVKSLAKGLRLEWPHLRCKEKACDLDKVRYPAVIQVFGLTPKSSSRTAYDVGLPFSKKPTAADITWVRGELQKLLDAEAGKTHVEPLDVSKLTKRVTTHGHIRLTLGSNVDVPVTAKASFEAQLQAMTKRLGAKALAVAKRAEGITTAPFDPKLGAYSRRVRTLPALVQVISWRPFVDVIFDLGVSRVQSDGTFDDFRRALWEIAEKG